MREKLSGHLCPSTVNIRASVAAGFANEATQRQHTRCYNLFEAHSLSIVSIILVSPARRRRCVGTPAAPG